ncbi:3-methyl-2-oxobutanoate hydroxymethyltransferase [Campylobacter curvus]|uniref:3-methyl-2-oxobutanoate hydroxymethyltransferase n=1 Tax=Campylobacter curvus TaxID=200 RepID=UPI001470227F|nr:3-methyl-2-oxobutanoate hydroxymethyltransferase [Campylobacter curvus]
MANDKKKLTVNDIKNKKIKGEPIVMMTAYDALFAKIFDDYADIILVGDSLNMSFHLKKETISATMEMMLYHTKAVCAGAKSSFILADMPFGSYSDERSALKNAMKFFKLTDVDAVKIEGGMKNVAIIKRLCEEGISVMGHIGLMPQFSKFEGGFKIKGRDETEAKRLMDEAKAIEQAGAFAILLEGTINSVAKQISDSVSVPVIGIGSGADVDGQVLVWSDMLGFFEDFKPKFAKRYLNGAELVRQSVQTYANEVKNRIFPSEEFSYKG